MTVCLIPADSRRPRKHKAAGIIFLLNRMMRYPVSQENKNEEKEIILAVAHNN
jgi:hypothetical protein